METFTRYDQKLEIILSTSARIFAEKGYHSTTTNTPDETKWVQLDLASSRPIGSITLYGASPTNDPAGSNPGAGFPVRYRIETSDDPAFGGQMTMTAWERRIISRSIARNTPRIRRDRLNAKFVSCCGRLECMSYKCGTRSSAESTMPMSPPSSCEWIAS